MPRCFCFRWLMLASIGLRPCLVRNFPCLLSAISMSALPVWRAPFAPATRERAEMHGLKSLQRQKLPLISLHIKARKSQKKNPKFGSLSARQRRYSRGLPRFLDRCIKKKKKRYRKTTPRVSLRASLCGGAGRSPRCRPWSAIRDAGISSPPEPAALCVCSRALNLT